MGWVEEGGDFWELNWTIRMILCKASVIRQPLCDEDERLQLLLAGADQRRLSFLIPI